ncbi:MAG TPA: phosphate propanoyltransferase [Clostridia bacterium]|nr:phosphate propanoyltransferase [Clostridia bacterium]
MNRDIVDLITERVKEELLKEYLIPVEVSARHVHLSQEHVEELFGHGYELTKKKELSQPGQYQCEERVMLIGPRGIISGVAVLGPPRRKTQVEITRTDSHTLGIDLPVRDSGDLERSGTVFIASPNAMVKGEESVIIAKRHIHMKNKDAEHLKVHDGQQVSVRIHGQRPLVFEDVLVRVSDSYSLSMHIDFDEANASGYTDGTVCSICRSFGEGCMK